MSRHGQGVFLLARDLINFVPRYGRYIRVPAAMESVVIASWFLIVGEI